jgi:hypothetical protein
MTKIIVPLQKGTFRPLQKIRMVPRLATILTFGVMGIP